MRYAAAVGTAGEVGRQERYTVQARREESGQYGEVERMAEEMSYRRRQAPEHTAGGMAGRWHAVSAVYAPRHAALLLVEA